MNLHTCNDLVGVHWTRLPLPLALPRGSGSSAAVQPRRNWLKPGLFLAGFNDRPCLFCLRSAAQETLSTEQWSANVGRSFTPDGLLTKQRPRSEEYARYVGRLHRDLNPMCAGTVKLHSSDQNGPYWSNINSQKRITSRRTKN